MEVACRRRQRRPTYKAGGAMLKISVAIITSILAIFSSMDACSEVIQVKAVKCREAPRENARAVAVLSRGTEVFVQSRLGNWRLVLAKGRSCWVPSQYVVAAQSNLPQRGFEGEQGRTPAVPVQHHTQSPSAAKWTVGPIHAVAAKRTRSSRSARSHSGGSRLHGYTPIPKRRSFGYGGGGACACSGGNVCVGPRGGRYCITSGGNRRYGV
ncbi:SH3 domain-containing protein [Sphingomonas trueperi]|uniref:SH3 domain-containing protein n=1 Tax=Sphingomonas trueperi TaxID=53317 RepID=UPI000EAD5415